MEERSCTLVKGKIVVPLNIHPRKPTLPLKNNCWKTVFLLKWSLFMWHVDLKLLKSDVWRLSSPFTRWPHPPDRSQRPQMQRATRSRNRQDDGFSDLDSRGQLHQTKIFSKQKSGQKSFRKSFCNHGRNYIAIELVSQRSVQIWILQPNEHLQVQDSTQSKCFENIRTPKKNTKTRPVLLASTSEFLHVQVIRDTGLVIQIGIQWNENWDPRMQEIGIRKWQAAMHIFWVHKFIYVNIYIF